MQDFDLSNVPQSEVPQSNVPQSDVPQSDVPQSEVPQSEVPQSDVPQHETGPDTSDTSSNPAAPHGVGSTTDISKVVSTESGSAHPDQERFARNRSFFHSLSHPNLSQDYSNPNQVSPNKGQQEGSTSSAQAETSAPPSEPVPLHEQLQSAINLPSNTSEPVPLHEQLQSAINLPSNTREVGTQTSDSSQNKTKFQFLEVAKTKIQKGFKRLTQTTRLGETCINLVNQKQVETKEQVESKELQLSQKSPSRSRTASLNAFEPQPFGKSLEEIPSGLKIQEGLTLNITGSLILKPDVLYKILNNEQDVLPEEMVQLLTSKPLIPTKRDKQLIENKPKAIQKPGLIDVYIAPQSKETDPGESNGVVVINNEGVLLSPHAGRALSDFQESLRSPENNEVLNLVATETETPISDLIKAVHNNLYSTINRAAVIAIDGNGQGVVETSFGLPSEFTKFNIATTSPSYDNLAPSGSHHKPSSRPFPRTTVPISQTNPQKPRATSKSPKAVAGNLSQNAHNQGQGQGQGQSPMSTQSNPVFSQKPLLPVRKKKFLGSSSSATQTGLAEASSYKRHQSQSQSEFDKNISERDEDKKKTIHQQ